MTNWRLAFFYSMAALLLRAQTRFDEFEVASIKKAELDARGRYIRMQTAHQFLAYNHALKTLMAAAYDVSPQAISGGPSWVESERYEILAKAPGDVRPNLKEQMTMLRAPVSYTHLSRAMIRRAAADAVPSRPRTPGRAAAPTPVSYTHLSSGTA